MVGSCKQGREILVTTKCGNRNVVNLCLDEKLLAPQVVGYI